ncbi:MAG: DUF1385 domain-containing protein [Armatimonadota bacterium]
MAEKSTNSYRYGGQAVIEGVMMRGKDHFAIACRRMNGEIETTVEPVENSILGKLKWLNRPLLRGTLAMIDSMFLGMKSLMWAGNLAMADEEAKIAAEEGSDANSKRTLTKEKSIKMGKTAYLIVTSILALLAIGIVFFAPVLLAKWFAASGWVSTVVKYKSAFRVALVLILGMSFIKWSTIAGPPEETQSTTGNANDIALNVTLFISMAIAIAVFMFLPIVLTKLALGHVTNSQIWKGLFEGGIKLVFLFLYIWGISRWDQIHRVFEYHGAEHKVINAFEAGEDLTVENVRKYTTVHVRCGTSFLLIVIFVSILIFSFISWKSVVLRFVYKLLFLPVVAGIAYEVIKIAGGRKDSKLMKFILGPGLLMQRITTQEPSDDQLEVSIRSLQSVREAEEEKLAVG